MMIAGEPPELRKMSGSQRAAALMLALGKENGAPIWDLLSPHETKILSSSISQLGRVAAPVVDHVLDRFANELSGMTTLHGSIESTQRLLEGLVPDALFREIMEDLRGPAGQTMWEKLANVNEVVLAGFLRSEAPQTVAVVLSKLRPEHAARVLAELPREFAVEVIQRTLRMDTVQREVLQDLEQTLRSEFISNLSRTQRRDPHEAMADVFNAMDRATEEAMLTALDGHAPDSAERIRSLMFTFEDLGNLMPSAISVIVRQADKREVAKAMKGAPEAMKQLFFSTMTERVAKMMREDMVAMGPVRARDCEEAQSALVRLAKRLAETGEIMLVDPKSDDTMIV